MPFAPPSYECYHPVTPCYKSYINIMKIVMAGDEVRGEDLNLAHAE